ncbi:MAG: hypothetical protein AAGH89_07795 [Verrucomicrobiota bacterium]
MNASNDDHYYQLLQRSFDGELTDAETVELREWLHQHPEAMERYLEHCQMESWLRDPALQTEPSEGKVISLSQEGATSQPRSNQSPIPQFPRWMMITAASVAFLLLASWFVNSIQPESETATSVARVIRVEGQGLVNAKRELVGGIELASGDRIEMKQGLVEMAFRDTGVHVIAAAPLSLTADNTGKMFLHDGEVKLHVPPQGVGFVVETEDRKITDLGTSFVVTAREDGGKLLVLDGEIAVANRDGSEERLMIEGEQANFEQGGKMTLHSKRPSGVPELDLLVGGLTERSLRGVIFGFEDPPPLPQIKPFQDLIGKQFLPLIRSGFSDRTSLSPLKQGESIRYAGIAGTYNRFPERTKLEPYANLLGWLAWYHGEVVPPQPGRYRFWGYADNQLLVSVDGKPVFEGSRYDSSFQEDLNVSRTNHPSFPCLNASAGFASGPWIELDGSKVQLDILFGEIYANATSGLLLVECESETYENTFWGQPKWPLFLTETPTSSEVRELEELRLHMEEKLMGSFSIANDAVWKVLPSN